MDYFALLSIAIIALINLIYFFIVPRIKENQKKYIDYFCIILFSLFIMTKNESVKDVHNYINAFENCDIWLREASNINIFNKYHSFEYGFLFLCRVFKITFDSIHFFWLSIVIFNVIFTPYFLAKITKNEKNIGYIRCTYITWYGILYSAIAVRAGIAITLGCGTVYFLMQKKYIKSIMFLVMAFLIQRSSIFFILLAILCFIGNNDVSKREKNRLFIISSCELFLVFMNINKKLLSSSQHIIHELLNTIKLDSYYYRYVHLENSTGIVTGKRAIIIVFIIWIIIALSILYKFNFKKYQAYILILVSSIITFIAINNSLYRIYDMALMFLIPVLSELNTFIREKNKSELLIITFIIYFFFFYNQLVICFLA